MIMPLFKPGAKKKPLTKTTVFLRVGFLAFLLIVGIGLLRVQAGKENNEVLGVAEKTSSSPTPLPSPSTPFKEKVVSVLQDTKESFTEGVGDILSSVISKTKEGATNIVIETTAQTIMSQVEKLPLKERQELKEALCR